MGRMQRLPRLDMLREMVAMVEELQEIAAMVEADATVFLALGELMAEVSRMVAEVDAEETAGTGRASDAG
jgi:glutamine phosphoribosylpyrophosphate amidotransferase